MGDYWIVGEYLDPNPEDLLRPINSFTDAVNKASHTSECYRNTIIAVWLRLDELQCVFINGKKFIPE